MSQLSSFAYGDIALTQTVLIKCIPHVTRQGIGEWLEYANPRKQIDKIIERNPHIEHYSTTVRLTAVDGKNREHIVYHPIGFLLIVMESGQPKAKQKKVEVAEFVWHFSNPNKLLFKPEDIEPKEYRSILSRITNLTSKMAKIRDAMDHKQTWLEITVLCDTIGMPYPAIEFMRKHFKQVELYGADAPYAEYSLQPIAIGLIMEKNDLLTPDELIELTGSRTVKKQMEVLKKHSIKFITRTDGKIRTTWTAVNTVLQPQPHKKADQEPNLDFLHRG